MFTGGNEADKAAKDKSEPGQTDAAADAGKDGQKRRKAIASPSILSADLTIRGEVETDGDLHIDGRIEGDVRSRRVTVGKEGQVTGAIIGDDVTIRGKVTGDVKARAVTLNKTAQVEATIEHDLLTVEPGAELLGRSVRRGAKARTALAAPEPTAPEPPAPEPTAQEQAPASSDKAGGQSPVEGTATTVTADARQSALPGAAPTGSNQDPAEGGAEDDAARSSGIRFKPIGGSQATPYS